MSDSPTKNTGNTRIPGRKQVFLAVPQWGVSPPECQDWRVITANRLGKVEAQPDCPWQFHFGTVSDMVVQAARDLICETAVDIGMDYVGMVDDDMYGPECFDMWEKMLRHDVDICAPLAFMRNAPHFPVIFANVGGVNTHTGNWDWKSCVIRNYPKNKLFECDAVGFGAVLIKTSVLKAMKKPWFFSMMKGKGEDIHFCHTAKEQGFRVFCDSSIHLDHLAPRRFVGEKNFEAVNRDNDEIREVHGEWSLEKARLNLKR